MSLRLLLVVVTVLAIPHGIAFILMPDFVAASYGLSPSSAVALVERLFGGVLPAWGAILWSARNFRDDGAVRAVHQSQRNGRSRKLDDWSGWLGHWQL